jgi:adenylyl cyclase-associated protein
MSLVEKEFNDLRALIHVAASCQKPDQKVFEELLNPLEADIKAVTRVKDDNRKDRDWFTHLSTVAEGAPCIGWVAAVGHSIN